MLPNPVSDGRLIARSLKVAGFQTVTLLENQNRAGMETALRTFAAQAERAQVALVYFAGHGIEYKGENYLIPVDARFQSDRDLEVEAVKLSTIVSLSEGASRLRIIVIDACRTPPPIRRTIATRSLSGGMVAPPEPEGESLIVYSAKAGTPALDGAGDNSPFATSLARRIVEPGREISLMFRQVRDDVLKATGKEQEPFTYGSLSSQEFYFVDPPKSVAGGLDVEAEAWSVCRDAATKGPCQSYLASFVRGKFASLARARIADLDGTPSPQGVASFSGTRPAPVSSFSTNTAPAAAPILSRMEAIQQLGVNVQSADDQSGILVRSVSPNGIAFGQLFAGDVIVGINSAAPTRGISAAQQIGGALESGYIKLLVKRGPSSTLVILRKPK